VSSGNLSLFAANEAIALTFVYTNIDNYCKNIEKHNKRIEQLRYLVNIENPSYSALLHELDELEDKKADEDQSPIIDDRIRWINDELSGLKTYSEVNIGTESFSGYESGRQISRIIEVVLEQEWFKDEGKHYLFPKHMIKNEEKIFESLRQLPLVP
jgi:hypothetical protein